MEEDKFITIRIARTDRNRLALLAAKGHRSVPQEISALLDLAEIMDKIPSLEFTGKGDEIGKAFKEWVHQ